MRLIMLLLSDLLILPYHVNCICTTDVLESVLTAKNKLI